MEVFMANFKKLLAYTAVTAAAVAGGIAIYNSAFFDKRIEDIVYVDFGIKRLGQYIFAKLWN